MREPKGQTPDPPASNTERITPINQDGLPGKRTLGFPLRPEVEEALNSSWERNKEAYRYLAR